jgi:low affinity Fe/Cu permease
VKLDELIAVTSGASNRAIGIERGNEADIDRMREALEARVDRFGEDDPSPSERV